MAKMSSISAHPISMAAAIWSALFMLVLWLAAQMGFYASAAQSMIGWHMFFDLTPMGLVTGMVEAAVISYVAVYSFVYVYNMVLSKK